MREDFDCGDNTNDKPLRLGPEVPRWRDFQLSNVAAPTIRQALWLELGDTAVTPIGPSFSLMLQEGKKVGKRNVNC